MSTATLERIMGHYKSNVRDLEFVLFEVLGVDRTLGTGAYADMDLDSAREVLAEVDRLATGPVADSFVDSDRNPPVFDPETGSVTLPASFKKSYESIVDGEWWRLWLPPHLGGLGAPPSLNWAANELLLGSNPGVFMYLAGFQFAAILDGIASADQKRWSELMVDKQWGSTMVLTEPDAGSDVGAGRTRATEQPDGSWHIEGVKRFITSGDSDLSENIVHLVLARPEGAGPGTKGLSLFIVPKFLVTDMETGALGERNGVYVTNVEKKMGLKASATCEMTFGEHQPAVGYLVGGVHDGIRQMFRVIENARMFVGTKAIATLSTGYLNALDFAKSRVQSADLTQAADKTAPRVTILHHPDVRRLLLLQKSYAEGMRALMLYAATYQDKVTAALAEGATDEDAERMNDLLLPLVKGVGSERSYELLAQSLQIFGGSGYLQDYPIEQYLRDSKIDTLYEGTTAIQGQDLFFRKIVKDQGRSLAVLTNEIQAFAKGDAGNGALARERALLGEALENVQGMLGTMVGYLTSAAEDVRQIYRVGLTSTTLLMSLGDLIIGWLLLREADVALAALAGSPSARDRAFYEGKVASSRWFVRNVLPELAARRTVTEGADLDVMDLAEEAF